MTVQIKMAKAEDRSTGVCNWLLGGTCGLGLYSVLSLSCALVAVVSYCCLLGLRGPRSRRQVCDIAQSVRAPRGNTGYLEACLDSWTTLFAFFHFLQENELQPFSPGFCPGHYWSFPLWIAGLHYQFSCWGKHGELKEWATRISLFSGIHASVCNG